MTICEECGAELITHGDEYTGICARCRIQGHDFLFLEEEALFLEHSTIALIEELAQITGGSQMQTLEYILSDWADNYGQAFVAGHRKEQAHA